MQTARSELEREIFHAERLMYVWVVVVFLNCVSLNLAQIVINCLPTLQWQALLALYLMWLAHSTPPCFLYSKHNPYHVRAAQSNQTKSWKFNFTSLSIAVLVGLGVFIPEAASLPGAVIVAIAVKACGTVCRHWVWLGLLRMPHKCSRLSWTLRYTVVSIGTYLMALGVFYAQRSTWSPTEDLTDTAEYKSNRVFMFGICYPVTRHVLRHCFAYLLNDSEGLRRTVRLYSIMSLDLPCYIMVYSHSNIHDVRIYLTLLIVIDTCYRLFPSGARKFALNKILWIKLLAVGSVITMWPSQEARDMYPRRATDFLERLLYAVAYLVVVAVLPHLLLTALRAIPLPLCQTTCQPHRSPLMPRATRLLPSTPSRAIPMRQLDTRVWSDTEEDMDGHDTIRASTPQPRRCRRIKRNRRRVSRRPTSQPPTAHHARSHLIRRVFKSHREVHDPGPLAISDVVMITLQLDSISLGMMAIAMLTTVRPVLVCEQV